MTQRLRELIIAGAAAVAVAMPAFAGTDEGLTAYDRGDYATAYREFAPAAARGQAFAEYMMARLLLSGAGVSRDISEGLKWLRKAAEADVGPAEYQLRARHEWGVDVAQDYAEAARWYRLAADHGIAEAQYRLGLLYTAGNGVRSDPLAAHMWFNLAASKLPPGEARNTVTTLRESIAAKLTSGQIAEAQKAAREWSPVMAR